LKFVDKISTDDLQTVKEKPVEAATEKVDEIVTKFSANIRHPDLFASFSDVLKHQAGSLCNSERCHQYRIEKWQTRQ